MGFGRAVARATERGEVEGERRAHPIKMVPPHIKVTLGSTRRGIQQAIRSREQKSGRQSILKIRILEFSTYSHCLKLKNQATLSTQLCLTAKTRTVAPGAQVPALPFLCIVKTKRTSPPLGRQHNIPPKDIQVLILRTCVRLYGKGELRLLIN